ncbi:hypothetical protein GCM10023403_56950 [Pseudonocardia benzenivorans]|nr:hypothetical protein PSD17_66070 [Pseudonocardia sp. D17]
MTIPTIRSAVASIPTPRRAEVRTLMDPPLARSGWSSRAAILTRPGAVDRSARPTDRVRRSRTVRDPDPAIREPVANVWAQGATVDAMARLLLRRRGGV